MSDVANNMMSAYLWAVVVMVAVGMIATAISNRS